MKTVEDLAKEIYNQFQHDKDCEKISMEEALEMAKMEIGYNGHDNKAKADKPKKKSPSRKADEDKRHLIEILRNCLNVYTTESGGISDLTITKVEREIDFTYNGEKYTIALTKHRPPK